MKILIYGAGVLGSLYATRLKQSGDQISILARGSRLKYLRENGFLLEEVLAGRRVVEHLELVEKLESRCYYDAIIVVVRRNQLSPVLLDLTRNANTPTILFMLNNAGGSAQLIDSVGRERVLLGFPGAAGTIENHAVKYVLIPQQFTTIGELHGRLTERVKRLREVFQKAGFKTQTCADMESWLKTHAIFITCVSGALYLADCDPRRLAKMNDALSLMVAGVRDGFRALHRLKIRVIPTKLRVLFEIVPRVFPVLYWKHYFESRLGELAFAAHVRVAADEIKALVTDVRALVREARVETPSLDLLYRAINVRTEERGR
jgi:2-dehydropantoate 2-reductase